MAVGAERNIQRRGRKKVGQRKDVAHFQPCHTGHVFKMADLLYSKTAHGWISHQHLKKKRKETSATD